MKQKQNGFGLVSIIMLVAVMIAGYVVISRIMENQEVQEVKNAATEAIDSAENALDKANETIDGATNLLESVPTN